MAMLAWPISGYLSLPITGQLLYKEGPLQAVVSCQRVWVNTDEILMWVFSFFCILCHWEICSKIEYWYFQCSFSPDVLCRI